MIKGANPERTSPVLMAGQPYTVVVALNMPESPRNLDLGMFMSCLQVASSDKSTKSGKKEIIRVPKIFSYPFDNFEIYSNIK